MLAYIARRIVTLIPILFLISLVSFIIIQLPPGDWVTRQITQLRLSGIQVGEDEALRLTKLYGLDKPGGERYIMWMKGILLEGNFGWSFQWNQPVNSLLAERIPLTMGISIASLIISWIIAIPIGIYSATHQYSVLDYIFTFIGFIGLATPGFLVALVLAWFIFTTTGFSPLGLYSNQFLDAPMSLAKLGDMLKHLILPLLIIGLSSTGVTIRVMRANLLDELKKQYVITARAKGLRELGLLLKYPVRMAINPIISTIGWVLPALVSGEVLVSIVLGIQTTGPLLLRAVLEQDMYLAGSTVMILSTLTVIGTLLSDILLAALDPRIRYGGVSK
ncbi:MAG: ABC transporter permease [Chloroflexi bacterium]|nr:ABC transporter permease [Chloroflexota bacterium]MCL5275224.1 ABC transporter permease [Chloroflexota bacterium]